MPFVGIIEGVAFLQLEHLLHQSAYPSDRISNFNQHVCSPTRHNRKVLDILADDDPDLSSTEACSLVCHDFLHICRKHIFGCILLSEKYDTPAVQVSNTFRSPVPPLTLNKLLSTSPEIANYITDLRCQIKPNSEGLNNPVVMQTFRKITHLQSLYYNSTGRDEQWTDNPLRPSCDLPVLPIISFKHCPTWLSSPWPVLPNRQPAPNTGASKTNARVPEICSHGDVLSSE